MATKNKKHWTEAMREVLSESEVRPTGDDWYSFEDVKKELNLQRSRAQEVIAELLRNKRCEVFYGKEKNARGRLSIKAWYRLT